MVITIARESGSGGQEVGHLLAKRLNLKFYDKDNLIDKAKEFHCEEELNAFLNEIPASDLLHSIAEQTDELPDASKAPFAFLRRLAREESFVLVGRCGNVALRGQKDLTSVFLHGNSESRIQRLMVTEHKSRLAARLAIEETDSNRRRFHEYYGNEEWGFSGNYQLTLDSNLLGTQACVDLICDFMKKTGQLDNDTV